MEIQDVLITQILPVLLATTFLLFSRPGSKYGFGRETERNVLYRCQNTYEFDVPATRIQWNTSRTRIRPKARKTKFEFYFAYPSKTGYIFPIEPLKDKSGIVSGKVDDLHDFMMTNWIRSAGRTRPQLGSPFLGKPAALHPRVKIFCFFAGFSTPQTRVPGKSMIFIKKQLKIERYCRK